MKKEEINTEEMKKMTFNCSSFDYAWDTFTCNDLFVDDVLKNFPLETLIAHIERTYSESEFSAAFYDILAREDYSREKKEIAETERGLK